MSDDHATPDPMDRAYSQAETLLVDDAARAARRAQVLDAVAREGAPIAPAAPVRRGVGWRYGGGLAAAAVAGLSALVAFQINRPEAVRPQVPSPAPVQAPAAQAPATGLAPAQAPTAGPPPAKPAPAHRAPVAPPAAEPGSADIVAAQPPSPPQPAPAAAAPRPALAPITAPPAAFRAAPALPPPAAAAPSTSTIEEMVVVTGDKRAAASAKAARIASPAPPSADPAARLRAAAALGQTADVEGLLAKGAAVDSPDAEGETALMKAIRADKPDVAALLRRHGASLELKNRAGLSAKEIAATVGDAELNRALGLEP
jgi:hypothetical protein